MISVVIPLYNKEQSIASTLQTVLTQTYQDFEIVIIDDGSTDYSVDEVRKVTDPRIRLIHQNNMGVSAARNRGIKEAKGEYIAFLDADDEWKPEYLKAQYELTQKYPECSVFACNYEFKDTQGKMKHTIIRKLPFEGEDGILSNYFVVASRSHPPLWTSAVMVRKNVIQSIEGFPAGLISGEDLLTWARLAVKYKIAFSTNVYAQYKILANSQSKNYVRDIQIKDIKKVPDTIGSEIESFYSISEGKLKKDIRLYLSFWYKMRASINLSLGYKSSVILCVNRSIYFNPLNWKAYRLYVMVLFPSFLIKNFLCHFRK